MRIVHVFRTPVGGLFRHVRDLVRGHKDLGHRCGVICDSTTGGSNAAALLRSIETFCDLGVTRIPISRLPGIGDVSGARAVAKVCEELKPDIVHGHGAKGGLYGRLAAKKLGLPSIYTPHGGSLHYDWGLNAGTIYLAAERHMRKIGSGLIFVCEHEKKRFDAKVGIAGKPFRIIYNGLWPEELVDVPAGSSAADIVSVGELRKLKGTDVLLRALALANAKRKVTATIVGDGEDRLAFESLARDLGIAANVTFTGVKPAREAFALGGLFVMPSRAESFPYVILEASAAGKPIVATSVGGIPELLPPSALVRPDDPEALANAMLERLANPDGLVQEGRDNSNRVAKDFDAARMGLEVAAFYRALSQSRAAA